MLEYICDLCFYVLKVIYEYVIWVFIMDKKQALARVEILISQITSEYEKGRDFCDSCDRVLAE